MQSDIWAILSLKMSMSGMPNTGKFLEGLQSSHFIAVVIFEWSEFFTEKLPCAFFSLIVLNIHAKNQKNPLDGFWEKLFINQPTNQPTK